MAQQQSAKRGGIKLRRSPKHANMYAAQFHRTERNKAMARARIARRKLENPNLKRGGVK